MTPTEIGLLYYAKCKLIAHHIEEADSVAALMQSQVQGGLRISTSVAFGRRVLVPLVMRFMKLNPKLPRTDILLALCLSELGQYKEALPGLGKAFQQTAVSPG